MEEFKDKNILNFVKELPDDDAYKAYLAKYKCQGKKGCMKKGYKYYFYDCHHVEISTKNTLFHQVKFGVHKTFCMVFEMTTISKILYRNQLG